MYRKTVTLYKKIRKRLITVNDLVGRRSGYKLKRVTYSLPATLAALEKFRSKEIRANEIGCAAGSNSLDVQEVYIKDPDWIVSS